MTNDISDTHLERAVPCFALSKNDAYLLSTSGGKFSLFNMFTFKVMSFNISSTFLGVQLPGRFIMGTHSDFFTPPLSEPKHLLCRR